MPTPAKIRMIIACAIGAGIALLYLIQADPFAAQRHAMDPRRDVATTERSWADFPLIATQPDARGGTISIGQSTDGLVIRGTITGPAPQWPRSDDEIARADHLDIWLADATPAEFPPIGWGHQHGYEVLRSDDECVKPAADWRHEPAKEEAQCRAWYRTQLTYRDTLAKLFIRHWQVAPGVGREIYATPAFAALTSDERTRNAALVPTGTLQGRFITGTADGGGYTCEILIPWDAFPPLCSLQLKDVRVLVEVTAAARADAASGPRTAIAADGTSASAGTPIVFALPAPRTYVITPCHYALTDAMPGLPEHDHYLPSEYATFFIRPTRALALDTVIVMDNEAFGYQDQAKASTRSPVAMPASFWSMPLASGTLCGPHLAYRDHEHRTTTTFELGAQEFIQTRALPDGNILIKAGPRVTSSRFGSGQCGGCPRVHLEIYHLNPRTATLTAALLGYFIDDEGEDSHTFDLTVSADWSTVHAYQRKFVGDSGLYTWERTTYRLPAGAISYVQGAAEPNVSPPSPRSLKADPDR